MTEFTGWPAEAIEFLTELEANNDRDWFKANRARYDTQIREPTAALGEQLSELGRPRMFRAYNDTRFTRSRPVPPIKEHIGLAIGYEGAGGYYVELSLDGLFVVGGLHNPMPDQVERLRAAVADGRKAAVLRKAIDGASQAGMALNEPDLKRAPRGYPPDHPRIDLLLRKRVVASRRVPIAKWMHTRAAGRRIEDSLRATTPLVEWLRKHVGPTDQPRERR